MTPLRSRVLIIRMLTPCFVTRLLTLLALTARAGADEWGMCTWPGLANHMNRMHEKIASLCCKRVLSIPSEDRRLGTLLCRDAYTCPLSQNACYSSVLS